MSEMLASCLLTILGYDLFFSFDFASIESILFSTQIFLVFIAH